MEDNPKGKILKMSANSKSFSRVTFEEFKQFASDGSMSKYEKIGFPDEYRKDKEINIFYDLNHKLKLNRKDLLVLDIGCGCSDLVTHLINNAKTNEQTLILVDSEEMLKHSPNDTCIVKIPGKFPDNFDQLSKYQSSIDAIIVYSVLQHIVLDSNPYSFFDKCLELLKPQGRLIIGDIPNYSKRNRFFQSQRGQDMHKEFSNNDGSKAPQTLYPDNFEKIDDGMLFGIMLRYRGLGFETYLVPQSDDLPMSTRREDLIIEKN